MDINGWDECSCCHCGLFCMRNNKVLKLVLSNGFHRMKFIRKLLKFEWQNFGENECIFKTRHKRSDNI